MSKEAFIDLERFAAAVKTRRGDAGLRAAATEIGGISAPTLSRIEQGGVPDLDTFLRICQWLRQPPSDFAKDPVSTEKVETPKMIEAHLRADRILAPEVISAISRMVELAYDAAKAHKI